MVEKIDVDPLLCDLKHDLFDGPHEDDLGPDYLNTSLVSFNLWFQGIHGYASIAVSVFGIFTNVVNVCVLTRRDMRSPTNMLLTWLAVSDLLTMAPHAVYMANFYCPPATPFDHPDKFSYGWAVYAMVTVHVLFTTHTTSIWLAVCLAATRACQVRSPARGPLVKRALMRKVKVLTLAVFVLSAVFVVGTSHRTAGLEAVQFDANVTVYMVRDLQLGTNHTSIPVLTNVLTYAMVGKLLPCLLIILFSGYLFCHLQHKRHYATATCGRAQRQERQARTTRMLLAVVVLFVLAEMPQGVLLILGTFLPGFYDSVFVPLGDLLDFLVLLISAVNFILYCTMCKKFRSKFMHMFFSCGEEHKDREGQLLRSCGTSPTGRVLATDDSKSMSQ